MVPPTASSGLRQELMPNPHQRTYTAGLRNNIHLCTNGEYRLADKPYRMGHFYVLHRILAKLR
jgi:hypothetical protein